MKRAIAYVSNQIFNLAPFQYGLARAVLENTIIIYTTITRSFSMDSLSSSRL